VYRVVLYMHIIIVIIQLYYFDKLIVIPRQLSNNKQLSDPVSDTKVFWLVLSCTSLL